jgi:hypothetical protein
MLLVAARKEVGSRLESAHHGLTHDLICTASGFH